MCRVNVKGYIAKYGVSFYANMFEEEKKDPTKANAIRTEITKKA